ADQSGFTLQDQTDRFKSLNAIVKASAPNPDNIDQPIVQIIDGLFPASGGVNNNFVPPGWSSTNKSDLYTRVNRVYCRACHSAQSQNLNWVRSDDWTNIFTSTIENDVCAGGEMPHAQVPFRRLWLGTDDAVSFLASSLGFTTCQEPIWRIRNT